MLRDETLNTTTNSPPVDEVEIEPGGLLVFLGVGEQVAGLFGGQALAVVGAEGDGAVLVPEQVEQAVGGPEGRRTVGWVVMPRELW